jgi:hypothetical protein
MSALEESPGHALHQAATALLGLLLSTPLAAGEPQTFERALPNGDFSAGLNEWTVETSPASAAPAGTVSVIAGAARLSKGGAFLVRLSQGFDAPEGLQALRLRIAQSPQFGATGRFIPEAFDVHLTGSNGFSRVASFRAEASAAVNAAALPAGFNFGGGASLEGDTLRIPIAGVAAGERLQIAVSLVGASADTVASVAIDDVRLVVLGDPPSPPFQVGSCTFFWDGFEGGFQAPPRPICYEGQVNDTGITVCADGSVAGYGLDCPVPGLPGQDAEAGRDALAAAGQLNKRGLGSAGFDYTKLDADGLPLPNSASDWACVADNTTGLVWERKRDAPAELRHRDHTYSWFQPDPAINGGDPGLAAGGSCTGSACDTLAYVQAVNAQGMCGANLWRLPTRAELITLIDNGRTAPAIDVGLFPDTPSAGYWSSTPSARDGTAAWIVVFSDGSVTTEPATAAYRVRLVRALP